MNITIRQLLNSIKFRSNKGEGGCLRLVLGERQVELPLDIKLTHGGGFAFVSIPKMVGIFKVKEGSDKKLSLVLQEDLADGKAASAALTPLLPVSASTKMPVPDLDPELTEALTKIPAGFKLIAVDGDVRLVRQRAKKEDEALDKTEDNATEAPKAGGKKELAGAGKK